MYPIPFRCSTSHTPACFAVSVLLFTSPSPGSLLSLPAERGGTEVWTGDAGGEQVIHFHLLQGDQLKWPCFSGTFF